MELSSNIDVYVKGELFDENGNLKQRFCKHNLITNVGFDFLCDAFAKVTRPNAMEYIAVGSGTKLVEASDTSLVSEVSRIKANYTHVNGSNFLGLSATFNAGVATGSLTEAGIFNAISGGVLFDRVTFPVINKEQLDTYKMEFTLIFKEVDVV